MSLQEYTTPRGVIAYDKRGLGEPVLLVHGIYPGASHLEYEHNVRSLQQSHTVYAINLLGFGQSDVPRITHTAQMHQHHLRDFIAEVIGKPSHVVASGVSCGIVARLGVYDDPLVRSLVLLSPATKPTYKEVPGLADRFANFFLGTLRAGHSLYEVDASDEGLWHWIKENYHDPKRVVRQKLRQLWTEANETNKMMAHISLLCGYLDTDLSNWLPYLRARVLIVLGVDMMPVASDGWFRKAQWSKEKIVELVDGAKAFPHEEQSARVNALIEHFIDTTNAD
jgi:pimeloyl-ACP methyl ester carboxylesterase